jgi:hypothetical protein
MLIHSYYKEIAPLLLKLFKDDRDKVIQWLYCPNYLFDYFTPIGLILSGDDRPLNWVKNQLELKK